MDSGVLQTVVTYQNPGKIPILKKPMGKKPEDVCKLIKELIEMYPSAIVNVIELVYGDEITIEPGLQYLSICDAEISAEIERAANEKVLR